MSKINRDTPTIDLEFLTPKETAAFSMSGSWLAKARMHKDGPPFIEIGAAFATARARFFVG